MVPGAPSRDGSPRRALSGAVRSTSKTEHPLRTPPTARSLPVLRSLVLPLTAGWIGLASAAHAACTLPGPRPSRFEITNLVEDPRRLLTRHPGGGSTLAFEVQSLAVASQETLSVVLKAVRAATPEQRQAIGLGLRRAAVYCLPKDASVAKRIDEGVQRLGDREVTLAYAGASDPRPLPGIGPAAPSASSSRLSSPNRPLDSSDLDLPDPGRISDPAAIR